MVISDSENTGFRPTNNFGGGESGQNSGQPNGVPDMPVENEKLRFFESISSAPQSPKNQGYPQDPFATPSQYPQVSPNDFRPVDNVPGNPYGNVYDAGGGVPSMPSEGMSIYERAAFPSQSGSSFPPAMPMEQMSPTIPSMPHEAEILIPEMPVGAPVAGSMGQSPLFGDDESDPNNPLKDSIDKKLGEGINKTKDWVEKRRNTLIKVTSIIVFSLVIVFALFKLMFAYTSDIMVKSVVKSMNTPAAYFSVAQVDMHKVVLTSLVSKDGIPLAKEVNITYNPWDVFLSKRIENITISGMEVVVNMDKETFSVPFLDALRDASFMSNGSPSYEIGKISIANSKMLLYGYANGSVSFTANGSLKNNLQITFPLNVDTNEFKGTAQVVLNGYSGNFTINVQNTALTYTDSSGYHSSISGDINLDMKDWKINVFEGKADYKFGTYNLLASAKVSYEGDKVDADLTVNTKLMDEVVAKVSTSGQQGATVAPAEDSAVRRASRYSRARRRANLAEKKASAEAAASLMEIPEELIASLPIGEFNLVVSQAKVSSDDGFKGYFPIKISTQNLTWGEFHINKVNFDAKGDIDCKDSTCSYSLSDNASFFLEGLLTPAFNSQFETMENIDIQILKSKKPLFSLSLDNFTFNTVLDKPVILGSLAGVTKPNLFAIETQQGVVSGFFDISGDYKLSVDLNNFNYSDSYYQIKKGMLRSSFSSSLPLSLKLKAGSFESKAANPLIASSEFELEARPDGKLHRFMAVWRKPSDKFMLFTKGIYDSLKDRGTARFALSPLTLTDKRKLEDFFPFTKGYIDSAKGSLAFEGSINWVASHITGPVTLKFKNFDIKKGPFEIKGLNSVFALNNVNPISTARGQKVNAKSINALIPFNNASMDVAISAGKTIHVANLKADVAGGRASTIETLAISKDLNDTPFLILVKGAKLNNLANMLKVPVEMTGSFDARLPLSLRPDNISIMLGDLKTQGNGFIRYKGADKNAKAAKIFSDLNFKEIVGVVDASLNGDMSLKLNVEGINPGVNGEAVFKDNLTVTGKTLDVLKR